MSRAIQLADFPRGRTTLPLVGQIAAGRPVLAVQQDESVDFANLFEAEDHYCLKVKGESMIEDQIADGDFVVVRKQETCRNGEIVVALVDGQEATLKKFYRERDRIRLEPANSTMKPIYSDNVQVMGVVVGVVRKY
jgi:repressor LexA